MFLDAKDQRYLNKMDRALEKLPAFHGTVYRNLVFDDYGGEEEYRWFLSIHVKDSIVGYPSYTSTSKAIDGYPVKGEFVIKLIISSETGKDLEGFGDNFEQEVIYQRNRRFYVEEVEEHDGIATIVMQEVPYGQESTEPETNTGRSDLASVQQMQAPDSKEGGLPGVSEGNSGRNPVQSGGSQETVSGGSRDSFRGEGLSDPTPRRERTEWQLYLDEYDRETARASAAPQRTKWQAYLDEYDRLWAELMELASKEPEQQDTVWKQYLREYDEAQRREEALKTVEILGYVPEEYAELFGVEPGTSWLVVRTYEQRRKLRAQRQNAEGEHWDPERPAVDGSADFSDREAFERTQPVRMEDDAPENAVDNSPERGIIGAKIAEKQKFVDRMTSVYDEDAGKIVSIEDINTEMYSSPIGADAAEYISDNGYYVEFNYDRGVVGIAGEINGKSITIYPQNNNDDAREMSGTIIHELCHERYSWNHTMEDEVNCRLMEIMHLKGYATDDDIRQIVAFVRREYNGAPEGDLYGY